MFRLAYVVAFFHTSLVYGKVTLQSPLGLESLGRNVVLGGISYFIPGWPEVRSSYRRLNFTL